MVHAAAHGRIERDRKSMQTLAELRRQFGCLLLVDDAHGFLTLGDFGGGAAEATGVSSQVDVHCGTLSKACGAMGGFVACSTALKTFLVNFARAYTYSTALPAPVVAGALAALEIAQRCVRGGFCAQTRAINAGMACHPYRLSQAVTTIALTMNTRGRSTVYGMAGVAMASCDS